MICFALIIGCAWFIFKLIDLSVTIDHQAQHVKVIEQQRDVLTQVLNSVTHGMPEEQVRELLKGLTAQSSFEKGEGLVVVGQVSFFFKNGKLVKISSG